MTLAVCVPIHDPEDVYSSYLLDLVSSILQQDLLPDQLVLAANHEIRNLPKLEAMIGGKFDLVTVRTAATNAPANLNEAVRTCKSDFVKILFQDDVLTSSSSLSSSLTSLMVGDAAWCAVKFDHLIEATREIVRPMVPRFTETLVRGTNKIGAPSVIMFRRASWIEFDERMVFTFDCDWYLSMKHRWGKPVINKNLGVTVRLHEGQATHWAQEKLKSEVDMMKRKHRKVDGCLFASSHLACSCLGGVRNPIETELSRNRS